MFSVYKPEKWFFSMWLLQTAPGWKPPAVLFLSFMAESAGLCSGDSQWQFLLTSCMVEEHGAAGGLVTLESVAATWRHSFSFTSFKLGTPCSHLVF